MTGADRDRPFSEMMDDRQKHYSSFEQFLKNAKVEFTQRLNAKISDNAKLDDFKILKVVGSGSFGKVVLCSYRHLEDRLLAMKIMEKKDIIKTKQLNHTIAEIRFLDALRFPFLVSLEYFFRNNVYIFIVMPFVSGGEMFFHLRNVGKFTEQLCKFYAAQIILTFEYIHYMGIVYRDLKPENILIDVEGYLKVVDLGFCKKIDNARTYTLCGTPEYLAPEIILSQGYNFSVDWWTLGILIFEMAAGFPPFYDRETMKLYEKIVAGKFTCPPHFSRALKDLATNLIQVDRTKRFGILKGGSKDVKQHEWFRNINFDDILYRKLIPSYKPSNIKEGDPKYFEADTKKFYLRKAPQVEYEADFFNLNVK